MATRIRREFLPLSILMLGITVANLAAAQTSTPPTLDEFRAQYASMMANFQEIGAAINNSRIIEDAQRGLIVMNQVTEDQWNAYLAQPAASQTVPNIANLSLATTLAVSRIHALASPMQTALDEQPKLPDFPTFGPNYSACPATYSDPAYIFAISQASGILGAIMNVLQFVCNESIPIPIVGGVINLAFVCIGISIAQGILGVLQDQMLACRLINGRASNVVSYQAQVYVANILRQETQDTQTLMNNNTQALIVQLREAQAQINTFENQLKDSIIAETAQAITTSQNALASSNSAALASVENSVIGTTASLITSAQNDIISHSNTNAAAIIANSNTQAAAILAELDADTQNELANLKADVRDITNTILQLGCEDLRLQTVANAQPSASISICSQPTQASGSSTGSSLTSTTTTTPSPSVSATSTGSSAIPSLAATAPSPVAVAGGCSGMGSENSAGSLPMILVLFLSVFAMRRRKTMTRSANPYLVLGALALFMNAAPSAQAQTTPTMDSFRTQYQESMTNLLEYFQATNNADGIIAVQKGITALAQVSNDDFATYFAQIPADANGQTIPDLQQLVTLSQTLVTALPAPQAAVPIDFTKPPEGFPPFGKDFCPSRTPNDAFYAITIANDVIDLTMSIMTWICYQQFGPVGPILLTICIVLGAIQAAIGLIHGTMVDCMFGEGGPDDYGALDFYQSDIQAQIGGVLQDESNLDTNQLSQQIIDTQTSIVNTDFDAYTAILAALNADVSAEQNSLIGTTGTGLASVENSIITTTATNLTIATNAINQNTDAQTAAILANANAQAAAIIAKAKADANTILQNIKAAANEILGIQRQLGCQNIEAQVAGQGHGLPSVPLCAGQPGF